MSLENSEWQHFSTPDSEAEYNSSASQNQKQFRIYLQGLQCSSCVHLLEHIPGLYSGIQSVRIDYAKSLALVTVTQNENLGTVCAAFSALGYEPSPIKRGESQDQMQVNEERQELRRIGLTAALAGNILLFAVPLYGGLTGELAEVFKAVQLILFVPILIYSAQPFYRGVVSAIAFKKLSVDLMITFALWAGFIMSCISFYSGQDDLYFDSTASFIFLILSVRFYLKKHQQRFFSQGLFAQIFKKAVYSVLTDRVNIKVEKMFDQIQAHQKLLIKKNQYIPVDGQLVSEEAFIDLSYLTGESEPQLIYAGDKIRAGSRLVSHSAQMLCLRPALQSDLALSLQDIKLNRSSSSSHQSIADQVSHWLTLSVFSLAAFYFFIMWSELGYEAFKRSLALITIACPCAVAFGTPLAQHLGLLKAFRHGYLVRDETVFEKLCEIKKIFFDKTGTLTSSQMQLAYVFPNNIPAEHQQIILGLEKDSLHPVALGFKKAWGDQKAQSLQVREMVGKGRVAILNGHEYRIEKASRETTELNADGLMRVDFLIDNQVAAYFFFVEELHTDAKDIIENLYSHRLEVFLLSGDRRPAVLDVSRKLGIRPQNAFSEQTVDSKREVICQNNPCLFVGDGLNDLKALEAATVGYAIRGPFEATMQISDIYAPGKNLAGIPEVFLLAQQTQRVIQTNILFAIAYNSIGGLLALGGLINPLIAAVLMPLSSLIISAHTVWRSR